MTKPFDLEQWVVEGQQNLDESWDKEFQHWLDAGFSHKDAELACFINRLPLGGIPTKYKEIRRRCLFLDEVNDLSQHSKDDLSRTLTCALSANLPNKVKAIVAAIKAKPDLNYIEDVIVRHQVIAAEKYLEQL